MFDSSLDIFSAVQRIQRLLKIPASPVRDQELRTIAKRIIEFLDRIDMTCMSRERLAHLKAAQTYASEATRTGQEAQLQAFVGAMEAYAATGTVYLLRHPEKAVGILRNIAGLRSLTDTGIRQAKRFGELLSNELLLSPKPVRVILLTSEISRTSTFAHIISRINDAKRLGKPVVVEGPSKDQRLFFGPNPEEFKKAYEAATRQYGQEDGDFRIVRQWLNHGQLAESASALASPQDAATLGQLISEGKLRDLDIAKSEMQSFVNDGLQMAKRNDEHVIVIGITHSMVFTAWLCNRFSKQEAGQMIPHTAEFARIEQDGFFYRGHWY